MRETELPNYSLRWMWPRRCKKILRIIPSKRKKKNSVYKKKSFWECHQYLINETEEHPKSSLPTASSIVHRVWTKNSVLPDKLIPTFQLMSVFREEGGWSGTGKREKWKQTLSFVHMLLSNTPYETGRNGDIGPGWLYINSKRASLKEVWMQRVRYITY